MDLLVEWRESRLYNVKWRWDDDCTHSLHCVISSLYCSHAHLRLINWKHSRPLTVIDGTRYLESLHSAPAPFRPYQDRDLESCRAHFKPTFPAHSNVSITWQFMRSISSHSEFQIIVMPSMSTHHRSAIETDQTHAHGFKHKDTHSRHSHQSFKTQISNSELVAIKLPLIYQISLPVLPQIRTARARNGRKSAASSP